MFKPRVAVCNSLGGRVCREKPWDVMARVIGSWRLSMHSKQHSSLICLLIGTTNDPISLSIRHKSLFCVEIVSKTLENADTLPNFTVVHLMKFPGPRESVRMVSV